MRSLKQNVYLYNGKNRIQITLTDPNLNEHHTDDGINVQNSSSLCQM